MFAFWLVAVCIALTLARDAKYYMTNKVKERFINMVGDDECTSDWPNAHNCVEWFTDPDEDLNYVITNVIPPYYVAPYCPFGPGLGYCLPAGATNCSMFYGMVCPSQSGRQNTTGDVEVAQIQLYAFPLNPDPTNATLPLNLYELNPLQWFYDPQMKKEVIVNHNEDTRKRQYIPFEKKDLFSLTTARGVHKSKRLIRLIIDDGENRKDGPPPPNPAYQTTGVHLAGIQIKGPAEAEGYNVDAVGIPLSCGGHVTPPIGGGPLYHYHKSSFCLMEYDKQVKHIQSKISKESILASFEVGIEDSTHSDLVGYANDGFGIYGFYDIQGVKPLVDECNGHFGCLDDKCVNVSYHYHTHNYTFVPANTFYPYWTGCLGPSKGICNTTVHQQYDNGANWCGPGCGYQICVQNGTNSDTLNAYVGSFGKPNWLKQFTINPY